MNDLAAIKVIKLEPGKWNISIDLGLDFITTERYVNKQN